jgi:CheY-like chemotaxis protein
LELADHFITSAPFPPYTFWCTSPRDRDYFWYRPCWQNHVRLKIPFLAEKTPETQKPRMSASTSTQPGGTPVKILVVDDNEVVVKTVCLKLKGAGYQVATAQDGAEAVSRVRMEKPDLILLDITFPPDVAGVPWDGFRIMEWLHRVDESRKIPIIIITGGEDIKNKDRAMASGAVAFFQKPINHDDLLELIRATLGTNARTPSAPPAATGNGESQWKGAGPITMADSEAEPAAPKEGPEFLKEAAAMIPKIREHSMGYIRAPGSEAGQTHLSGLHRRVHLLNSCAAQAGCARVGLLTNAIAALLSEIMGKPSMGTPPMLQTIAQAVDCLEGLLKNDDGYSVGPPFKANVLVVEDDTVCNHVNVTSLQRAKFDAVGVKDPAAALSLLETTAFDLIMLDVNMPGMNGFEVCEKMRRLPHCKKTPVIFVTAFSNFDNRRQSVLSGANDFLSKPVSPLELELKVTVNLIMARAQGVRPPQQKTHSAENNGSADALPPATSARVNQPIKAETQPEPESNPAKTPTPASQRSNGETQSADIREGLRQSTAALEHAKASLEQESVERARLESQTRKQLNAAKVLIGQTETVLKENEARCSRLEEELAGLRRERDELQTKFVAEQQAAGKSQHELKELKTNLENQSAQRVRLETEWREQLDAAKATAGQKEMVLKEREARCGQLEKDLAGLQQVHDEVQNKFSAEQQAVTKSKQEIKELQERLRQGGTELERAKNGWEQESAKRARMESDYKIMVDAQEALDLELRGLRERQAARETELQDKQRKLAEGLRESIQLFQLRLQEAENLVL